MKILMRGLSEKQWHLVESAVYSKEGELQRLLAESPELISINDLRPNASPLVFAVPEFALPVGYIDLLAFNADGDIAIIECKLAANPEAKRKVIGQVLEYGAFLWGMRYEDLDQGVANRLNAPLAELVGKKIQPQEWAEESFRKNVAEALASGNFILVIVVDEINDELSRIVSFINACGNPSFNFAALEMRRFQTEKVEMLVPRVFGPKHTGKAVPPAQQWTKDTHFAALLKSSGEPAVMVANRILNWAEQKKLQIWWGKGKEMGSFVPLFSHKGKNHQLFAVYTYGVVLLYFNWYAFKPPFDTEVKRIELLNRLNQIQGVNIPPEGIKKQPGIKLLDLATGNRVDQFLSVYDWFVEEVLKS